MNSKKILSISIIIASVVISLPLWRIAHTLSPSSPGIVLPDYASIKQQVEKFCSSSTVKGYRYSIDKTQLLLDVTYLRDGSNWQSSVMYKMDDFGRFRRISNQEEFKRNFPFEIK